MYFTVALYYVQKKILSIEMRIPPLRESQVATDPSPEGIDIGSKEDS